MQSSNISENSFILLVNGMNRQGTITTIVAIAKRIYFDFIVIILFLSFHYSLIKVIPKVVGPQWQATVHPAWVCTIVSKRTFSEIAFFAASISATPPFGSAIAIIALSVHTLPQEVSSEGRRSTVLRICSWIQSARSCYFAGSSFFFAQLQLHNSVAVGIQFFA